MSANLRRLAITTAAMAMLLAFPGNAAADCNGPACEPFQPVEGSVIVATVAVLAVFIAIMAARELRRR